MIQTNFLPFRLSKRYEVGARVRWSVEWLIEERILITNNFFMYM